MNIVANTQSIIFIGIICFTLITIIVLLIKSKYKIDANKNGISVNRVTELQKNGIFVEQSLLNSLAKEAKYIGEQIKELENMTIESQKIYARTRTDTMLEEMALKICNKYGWIRGSTEYNHIETILGWGAFAGHELLSTIFYRNHFDMIKLDKWDNYKQLQADYIFPKVENTIIDRYDSQLTHIPFKQFVQDNENEMREINKKAVYEMLDNARSISCDKTLQLHTLEKKLTDLPYDLQLLTNQEIKKDKNT